jgi:hypothetical protein
MKKYVYYHLYLPNEAAAWSNYLLEQFKMCEDNRLIDHIEKFFLVVVGKPENVRLAKGLAKSLSDKIEVIEFEDRFKDDKDLHTLDSDLYGRNVRPITEYATLQLIYEHALREDAHFLYMHAKGVTSYERHLRSGKFEEFKNYFYWRKFLEWACVERWQECNELLNKYDVVGCNFAPWPMKHFSGNYWWSKSEYIRTIPDIRNDDWWKFELQRCPTMQNLTWRLRDEMWICCKDDAKIVSLKNADQPPPQSNLACEFMPRRKYEPYN